jgi:hypothetical protein
MRIGFCGHAAVHIAIENNSQVQIKRLAIRGAGTITIL